MKWFGCSVIIFFMIISAGNSRDFVGISNTLEGCRDLLENDRESDELKIGVHNLAGYLLIMDPNHPGIPEVAAFLSGLPDDLESLTVAGAEAYHLMMIKQPEKASEIYLELILRYPSHPDINRYRIALARAFRESGRLRQAIAQLESILKQAPVLAPWVLLERAKIHTLEDEQDDALRTVARIIDRFGDSYPARMAESLQKTLLFNRILGSGQGASQ